MRMEGLLLTTICMKTLFPRMMKVSVGSLDIDLVSFTTCVTRLFYFIVGSEGRHIEKGGYLKLMGCMA